MNAREAGQLLDQWHDELVDRRRRRLTDDTREVLTAGYVTDLEPVDVGPYLRTYAESPYVPLDYDRQEPRP